MSEHDELRMSAKSREIIDYILDPGNRPFYALQLTDDADFPVNRVYFLLHRLEGRGLLRHVLPPEGCDEFSKGALHYDLTDNAEEILQTVQPTRLEQMVGRIASVAGIHR